MATITEQLKVALADRYLIERELGEGGMATVYLAAVHRRPPSGGQCGVAGVGHAVAAVLLGVVECPVCGREYLGVLG